jgi:energy-coupling factor transport system permease protein
MIFRRGQASPLHAARASAGSLYCAALATAALVYENPIVLAAVAVATVAAGLLARVGPELARAARFAVPLALLVALINPFVVREGLTVFARLGELPPLGQVDLTVEALVYGTLLGARVVVVVLAFALFAAAVDPDEVLRLFRRVSFRSALTASLATRLLPVLARDARRLEQARRCRPDGGGSGPAARAVVMRAVATGALDRAVDVAATLEVRGYGAARRPGRVQAPWSRHDLAFMAASLGVLATAVGGRLAGVAGFAAYPRLVVEAGPAEIGLAAVVALVALLPFADRQGIVR